MRRLVDWPPAAVAILLACSLAFLGVVASLAADFDGDGLSAYAESRLGTQPLYGDTDRDGLADGDEIALGSDPHRRHSDDDGLEDGEDVARGGSPILADTDADGIPDPFEPDVDCDGDGVPAIRDPDDDDDGILDGDEPPEWRCLQDVDQDGLRDGGEGNPICVVLPDCDGDGLPDRFELDHQFDPLDPDTRGVGFIDGVVWAFESQGQSIGPDADGDGIPDAWENQTAPFSWGPFAPQPGQRDLLVEYVRVIGPDSKRFSWLDFDPTYEAVAALFAEANITLQWTETIVELPEEERPDFLSPTDLEYFGRVLGQANASTNPYVTSVVLNPQQVQRHLGEILGAAFLRNMLATVDYGPHTEIHFTSDDGVDVTIRPIVESHIQSGNPHLVTAYGFDSGGILSDGRIFLRDEFSPSLRQGYRVSWQPEWFRTAPLYVADDGQSLQLRHNGATLRTGELASTIAHEIGHTLGLCHTHEASCIQTYTGLTQEDLHTSTMSYAAPPGTMRFAGPEWQRLLANLDCPPQATVGVLAAGGAQDDVLETKYQAAFTGEVVQRACLAELAVEKTIFATDHEAAGEPFAIRPVRGGVGGLTAYVLGTALLAIGGAIVVLRSRSGLE